MKPLKTLRQERQTRSCVRFPEAQACLAQRKMAGVDDQHRWVDIQAEEAEQP
jgi:hypothetical protein